MVGLKSFRNARQQAVGRTPLSVLGRTGVGVAFADFRCFVSMAGAVRAMANSRHAQVVTSGGQHFLGFLDVMSGAVGLLAQLDGNLFVLAVVHVDDGLDVGSIVELGLVKVQLLLLQASLGVAHGLGCSRSLVQVR
ncbi:hypothetical protein PG985_005275 [Apiospora marii]|uniref:uncharacterized protein n=1 Tax=Apiospora marii TaxID=335849 RepID=UPI00313042D5